MDHDPPMLSTALNDISSHMTFTIRLHFLNKIPLTSALSLISNRIKKSVLYLLVPTT